MNAFHNFLSRLSASGSMVVVKVKDQDATAQCPAHDDRVQSLHITRSEKGVLLKCFAGCTAESICDSLGLSLSDLFDDGEVQAETGEVYYDYCDEDGTLLNQVVRMFPKSFRQRRPDGKGGWIYNLDGVRRVMYRLNELQNKRAALLVEGEKDADNLWKHKLPATTTLGGSSAWRPEFAEQLADAGVKRLGILPDNDAPGQKYAEAAAADCHLAGIHVSIIQLPGLPPKGDVSDFLAAAAHPRGDLIRAIQACQVHPTAPLSDDADLAAALEGVPEWEPSQPEPEASDGLIIRGLDGVNARPTNWLWEDRIPRGELSLIVGDPSAGKTFVTQAISVAAADGKDWPLGLGGRATLGKVVYVTVEDNPETSMKPRMKAMGLVREENVVLVEGFREGGRPRTVSIIDDLPAIETLCAQSKAVMLVISPINSYLHTKQKKAVNGYKDEDVRDVLTPLVQLAQRLDIAVIGVMHMNKNEQTSVMYRIGGSIAFAAVPRIVYCVLRSHEDRSRRYLGVLKASDMIEPQTMEFHVESAPGTKTGRVVWDGETDKTVFDLLAEAQQKKSKAKQDKAERHAACVAWLEFLLQRGPQEKLAIEQAGWGDGQKYTKRDIERAAEALGVEKTHAGPKDPWIWKLKGGSDAA